VPSGDTLVPFADRWYGYADGVGSAADAGQLINLYGVPNKSSWKMQGSGVQLRLAYARLVSEEATRLLEFCAGKSIGLPTQNFVSVLTTPATKGSSAVNFNIDQPNIDMIVYTFPYSTTVLDYCPNPWLVNAEFKAQGRTLGGQ
jgi:hypothetical protein